ncbi:MAG: DUF4407 domain-containing protein [Flavipsychrobacter sp.]
MANLKRNNLLLYPKRLIDLIGIDYRILLKTKSKVIYRFYFTGFLVLFVVALSLVSVFYAFELLFHRWFVEFALSSFFSILLLFMYLLIINTFSKQGGKDEHEDDKVITDRRRKVSDIFKLPQLLRLSFIGFMGFIISVPINIYFFQNSVDSEMAAFKQELIANFENRIVSLDEHEVIELKKRKDFYEKQYSLGVNAVKEPISRIEQKLNDVRNKQNQLVGQVRNEVYSAYFFVQRINIIYSSQLVSYLISFLIISIFILPILLIYFISNDNDYYALKRKYANELIDFHSVATNEKYINIFKEKFDVRISKRYTAKEDPFNRRFEQKVNTQSDFQKDFINNQSEL